MPIPTSTTVPVASGTAGFIAPPDLAIAGARISAALRLARTDAAADSRTVDDPETPEDLSWIHRYRRRLLDFLGASPDVDLDAVNIVAGYEAPYECFGHSGGGYFSIDVSWQEMEPRKGPFSRERDFEGPFERHAQLTNEQVAQFLSSLESPT
ncbi:hypothetical protein [Cryobacterium zhongshanensis]|uniref:Uncharacterized protein n=1 Tax=Cryobacterium zhongshanensis TaxID=2928153 RepID=A0AA41UHB4_9MICO|nr:hypothetical protein [Cryobacterium zhongshanensis]MCI4659735.1 hypothetical protein [Cryobacterium zhongshanensis]